MFGVPENLMHIGEKIYTTVQKFDVCFLKCFKKFLKLTDAAFLLIKIQ